MIFLSLFHPDIDFSFSFRITGSAEKYRGGGGIMSSLYSFLPSSKKKPPVPTSEEKQKLIEDKIREKEKQVRESQAFLGLPNLTFSEFSGR